MRRRALLNNGEIDYSKQYFTIVSLSDNNEIGWKSNNVNWSKYIYISTDNGVTWEEKLSSNTGTLLSTLNKGDKMLVKFYGATAYGSSAGYYSYFTSTQDFGVEGNIMSLLTDDNFTEANSISSSYTFYYLFYYCTKLKSAENLVLPATTLATYCYAYMFSYCTSLTTVPLLPATTLSSGCYTGMFFNCASITTAPELPATDLYNVLQAYNSMFYGCSSLTIAPALPATTLASYCYSSMFKNCSSLTTAPELPATTLATYCYSYMFQGCSSLTTAPLLPAWELVSNCYNYMFDGCSNLNYIKAMFTTTPSSSYTSNWVSGVAASGTFVKNGAAEWGLTGVNGVPSGWTVEYSMDDAGFFTIESLVDNNTIKFYDVGSLGAKTINFAKENGSFQAKSSSESGTTITTLNRGEKIYLKGTNSTYATSSSKYSKFGMSGECKVYGNIMSLISRNSFHTLTAFTSDYAFCYLFKGASIVDASELLLPATSTRAYAYLGMFSGCRSLIKAPKIIPSGGYGVCYMMFQNCSALTEAPELPATLASNYCYQYMFSGCSKLTKAPALPATNVYTNCYQNMFYSCTSLTTAPELPATTLTDYSYYNMFYGCSKLSYIKCLATNISATGCTEGWVKNVAANGLFVKPDSMNSWTTGDNGIPSGWISVGKLDMYVLIISNADNNTIGFKASSSSLLKTISVSSNKGGTWTEYTSSTEGTVIGVLSEGEMLLVKGVETAYADTNDYNCFTSTASFSVKGNIMSLLYGEDFADKVSLSGKSYAFKNLFKDCAYLEDASELLLPATTLSLSCYQGMFDGCTEMNYAPELPATTLAESCYQGMFNNCASLTAVPELPATTLEESCYAYMFKDCKCINEVLLPAETLEDYCYQGMFYGCSRLSYIKCPATDISATGCTEGWVNGVARRGVFTRGDDMEWTTGISGIPNGWSEEKWSKYQYLTFTALQSGTFTLTVPASVTSGYVTRVSYSTNGGATWTTTAITSSAQTITTPTISVGGKVLWKGIAIHYSTYGNDANSCKFSATGRFNVNGNIMSLLYGDDFSDRETLSSSNNYTFFELFYNNSKLVSAKNLILPATTLTTFCYGYMFSGCTALTTAPALPATTLAEYCYSNMFDGCYALTAAPELPAKTLAYCCYISMFRSCRALTTAPALPATVLANSCYQNMFSSCYALTAAPELPAKTLVSSCYHSMFYSCSSLTTVPALPATTLANNCYQNMFYGCSSLTTAPDLPATTLVNSCYYYMFFNCSKLSYIKCLATDTSATGCTEGWVKNVAASGTFVCKSSVYFETGINGIPSGWTVDGFYDKKYLTIISEADNNTIGFQANNAELLKTISVSTDNGETWTEYTSSTSGTTLATLDDGETILIKGSNTEYATSNQNYNFFTSTENFYVEGNIMSMLYGDNFAAQKSLRGSGYDFYCLFKNSKLKNAELFILPATTLTTYCYGSMFNYCTILTTAPVLPATTLATYCYSNMFYNCSSLTTVSALPATTLANYCYEYMFYSCATLTKAPALFATTLATYCYQYMFKNCISLTTAPTLPATTLKRSCYMYMFQGCSNLTTAPALPATTLAQHCYAHMFQGCSNLTTAPALPATTLEQYCYSYMFQSCSKLTTVPDLYATTLANNCCSNMFDGCTALKTAPALPATTLADYCYQYMFYNCTALTTPPALPATTLKTGCYCYMFRYCSKLTTAPELPATTLVSSCYAYMFNNCSKLNYIKAMFITSPGSSYTNYWVGSVAATGTFVKNSAATWTLTGNNGIPSRWTVETASS